VRRFKLENPSAKLTAEQFKQILIMRRMEVEREKMKSDMSKISINEESLAVKPSEADSAAERESDRLAHTRQRREAAANHALAKLLAQLHSCLPPSQQAELITATRGALKDHPPTVTMPDFANAVVAMCRGHAPDDEGGLDMEVGFREWFAEALDVPAESFDQLQGGIPRKIFARMMQKRRAREREREGELRAQGLGDADDTPAHHGKTRMERVEEEEEERQGIDHAPPTGFGGAKGDYMRERLMQIPAEKRDKMLRGMPI